MHTAMLAASVACLLSQHAPNPTQPTASGSVEVVSLASLPATQQDAIALASIELSPETLAASGFTPSQFTAITSTLRGQNALARIQSDLNASAAQASNVSSTNGGTEVTAAPSNRPQQQLHFAQRAASMRRVVVMAAAPNITATQLAVLERCILGSREGLPASLAVACTTPNERHAALAALTAETRANRLGRPLSQRHADMLHALRARPEAAAADQGLSSHVAAMRQALSTPTAPADTSR